MNDMKDYSETINSAPLVLVEFFASWCPHCQRMMSIVDEVKGKVKGIAEVYQFDVDRNPTLTETVGVESYPTFILYKNGNEVCRDSGEMTAETILGAIRHHESHD